MKTCVYEKVENGLKRDFPTIGKAIVINGSVKETAIHKFSNTSVEVINIKDDSLDGFDWEEMYDEFGQWYLGENLDGALDMLLEDQEDSPYIWNSALIKAKGEYWIVSFDFFQNGLLVEEIDLQK